MSRNYDNWERLVDAVFKRLQFLQLAHAQSRSPSTRSESSDFSSPLHNVPFRFSNAGSSSAASGEQKEAEAEAALSNSQRQKEVAAEAAISKSQRSPPKQRMVLKINIVDDREKRIAMKAASSVYGVDSISMNTREKKLTVIGDCDPVQLVTKLRKSCYTEILIVERVVPDGR